MKKYGLILLISLIVFSACKKDQDKPSPVPSPSPSAPAVPKIKFTRTLYYHQDSLHSITTGTCVYNFTGQMLSNNYTDSTYSGSGWLVETHMQIFNYTTFNKIGSMSMYGSFGIFVREYLYDSNEKLIAEVDNGQSDTLRYTYNGNQIIGERTSNSSNQRLYYSENLDSTTFVDISTFTSTKVVYKRNTKVDAGNSYMNPFWGIVANKHELVQEIQTTTSIQGSTTTTNTITRTYNSNGFPKTVTVEQGPDDVYVTHYSYY